MKFEINRLIRQVTGANNQWPIKIIENSKLPPEIRGESYYFTTLSGKTVINHPSSYKWPMWYHNSTKHVVVGKEWFPKIPKGMELRNDSGTYLIRLSDKMDLHFKPEQLFRKDFCSWARREMAKNYKNRVISNSLNKQFLNDVKNTFVNFNDAQRAGNCAHGIIDYAKRYLNIDKEQLLNASWLTQVPAKLLLRIDPNNKLVKNSINQAYLRETLVCI